MLPDNRIRFSSTRIDFDTEVGNGSQDIDFYPAPHSQARYDWLRSVILGLLGSQSSYSEPTQYRDGTPWFDLNTLTLKIRKNNEWAPYSDVIALDDDTTLASWYNSVSAAIQTLGSEIVYSGSCTADGTTLITIPESLRTSLFADSRPFVYINGILVDPRSSRLEPGPIPTAVKLTSTTIDAGDSFTVMIRRVPSTTFHSSSESIP